LRNIAVDPVSLETGGEKTPRELRITRRKKTEVGIDH